MAKKQIVKIAAFLAKEIEAQGIAVSKVILFGSQARGGATAESDIDIAVVSADFRGRVHDGVKSLLSTRMLMVKI